MTDRKRDEAEQNVLNQIAENRRVGLWGQWLTRNPSQQNATHETDAELVPIPGTNLALAITTDTVAEEIALGFYRDPETIGWMAATVSLSDLAAVGATPLGIVVAATLPRDANPALQQGLAHGLDAACRSAGTHVLGGDTNWGDTLSVTTTAVGTVEPARALRRTGCAAGDVLYVSGPLGTGGACAARALFDLSPTLFAESHYRPRARIAESRALHGFATTCMDTSDGLIATLDQLFRLNNVGFEIDRPLCDLIEPRALAVAKSLGVDPLLLLAQHHGEFELVFTVRAESRERFEAHAESHGFVPLRVGCVIAEPVLRFIDGARIRIIDGARVRNLADEISGDLKRYLADLILLVDRS